MFQSEANFTKNVTHWDILIETFFSVSPFCKNWKNGLNKSVNAFACKFSAKLSCIFMTLISLLNQGQPKSGHFLKIRI